MSGDKDKDANDIPRLDKLDTLRPPPGTDAYTAETVVRQAPPELIAAARAARREQLLAREAKADAKPPPTSGPVSAPVSAPISAPLSPPVSDGALLPALEDAESVDGDNVETQLWDSRKEDELLPVASAPSPPLQAEPRRSAAPLDNTNPLFVMLVLLVALLAGAALAYWLSAPQPPH